MHIQMTIFFIIFFKEKKKSLEHEQNILKSKFVEYVRL